MRCFQVHSMLGLLRLATCLALSSSAGAASGVGPVMREGIDLDDIASPQIEDFEGIIGVTVPAGLFSGFMYGAPPANVPLPSGLTLTFPDPNSPTGTGFIIGDYAADQGGGAYGLGENGTIFSPADIHSGTAFAGAGVGRDMIYRFAFPMPVADFGMFAAAETGQVTLTTFTPAGNQIESVTFDTISLPLTDSSFIGLGNTEPIGSFEIRSDGFFVWDDVLWEECVVLDFETEDDFVTPLVNGQAITSPPEFGRVVQINGFGPHTYGTAIFDSDPTGPNAGGSDRDLLIDQGNILILQENPTQTTPDIYDNPDDAQLGGSMVFDFLEPVQLCSVDLIDICPGPPVQDVTLTIFDEEFEFRMYFVPGGWTNDLFNDGPPGFGTLDLTTLDPQPGFMTTATANETTRFDAANAIRLEVLFNSSGALDNLQYDPSPVSARTKGRLPLVPPRVPTTSTPPRSSSMPRAGALGPRLRDAGRSVRVSPSKTVDSR